MEVHVGTNVVSAGRDVDQKNLDNLSYTDEQIEREYCWRVGIFQGMGYPREEAMEMARVLTDSWKRNVLGL